MACGKLRWRTTSVVAVAIRMALIKEVKRTEEVLPSPLANPKPAVHNGGINAVAMATPGMTLLFSLREPARMPVKPPNKATNTSRNVGLVRANSSLPASSIGEMRK